MDRDTLNKLIKKESIADIPILYVIRILVAIAEVENVQGI